MTNLRALLERQAAAVLMVNGQTTRPLRDLPEWVDPQDVQVAVVDLPRQRMVVYLSHMWGPYMYALGVTTNAGRASWLVVTCTAERWGQYLDRVRR